MFENCKSLRDLNAERAQLASDPNCDLIAVNNAYNEARQRILSEKKDYRVADKITVTARDVVMHYAIPLAGRCRDASTISLTETGFLY